MTMENEVFSMNRFWRYFKSDFNAFVSRYGITLLVLSTMAVTTDAFNGLISFIFSGNWIGMIAPLRFLLFAIFAIIVLFTAPAKLYGHLTDRKEGSAFLMVPASRLEKYVSMVLITGIVVPLVFGLIYLGLDIMVCMIDHTCGESMFSYLFFTDFRSIFSGSVDTVEMEDWGEFFNSMSSVFTPFLYLDDIFQTLMLFLLGALIFKTSKTGKTLGCLILIGLSLEMILSPIIALTALDKIRVLAESDINFYSSEMFCENFPLISWMMRHLVLVDTISDGLMNCLILFLIWVRFKRIKH